MTKKKTNLKVVNGQLRNNQRQRNKGKQERDLKNYNNFKYSSELSAYAKV